MKKLTTNQLKEIKDSFNSKKNYYSLYNEKKLKEIEQKLSKTNRENTNREQFINRIHKFSLKPFR